MTDGRGNSVHSYAYNGSTGQVSAATIDGHAVSYSYTTGRTDRTDRLGNVHRASYSGKNITQTDLWISNQARIRRLP